MDAVVKRTAEGVRRLLRGAIRQFSIRNRQNKAKAIVDLMGRTGVRTVLFLGVGGTGTGPYERIVEARVVEAASWAVGSDLLPMRPPFTFVQADGRRLPFRGGPSTWSCRTR